MNRLGRPKPTIIISKTDSTTHRTKEIIKTEAIYAIFYDGQPIGVRSDSYAYQSTKKYPRHTFPTLAVAKNKAKNLNKFFGTDKFAVYKLTQGELVTE
jgi:hypothetical protein